MRFSRRSTLKLSLCCAVLWAHVTALCAAESVPAVNRRPSVPELTVEKFKLPNGLTVTLHEDHKTPLVALNLIYNVGSKDDPPGKSGVAHLVEHLMFEGSQHCDESYYFPIYQFYTEAQGSTGKDRTVYHVTLTSNALELALWLEADRMGFLARLDHASQARQCEGRGQERAPPAAGRPAVRTGSGGNPRIDVSARPSLSARRHWLHGGHLGRSAERRDRVLESALRAEQRIPLRGR